MAVRGRIHPRVQDARTEAELSNIYDILQNLKVNGETIDPDSVSQSIGRNMKDGQLEVLNRLINGLTIARKLLVQNTKEDGPCLYLNRTGTGGSTGVLGDAVLALANTGSGDTILEENGAKLTSAGVWTNASSIELKEDFREIPEEELFDRIETLPIREYTYKRDGSRHVGPTAEDFFDAFGLGGNKGIAGSDMASLALLGVKFLLDRIRNLEQKIEELENNGNR